MTNQAVRIFAATEALHCRLCFKTARASVSTLVLVVSVSRLRTPMRQESFAHIWVALGIVPWLATSGNQSNRATRVLLEMRIAELLTSQAPPEAEQKEETVPIEVR